jgi:hypothetical protein
MERLRRFLHRELNEKSLRDDDALEEFGARPRWVPEELEDFDEVELALPLDEERDLVVSLALEEGRIERMMLGRAPAGDDDADVATLGEEALASALESHGETVVRLLAYLTGA